MLRRWIHLVRSVSAPSLWQTLCFPIFSSDDNSWLAFSPLYSASKTLLQSLAPFSFLDSTISLLTEGPHMRGCLTVIWRSPKAWQVGSSPPITCWTVAWFPLLWHFSCFKLQFLSGWENNISRPAAYYCPFAASSLWSGEVLPSSVAHCPECFPIWTGFPSRQVPTEFLPLYPRGTERTRFCRSALLTSHSHHSTAAYFPSRLFRDA